MIKSMTKEQEERLPVYLNKWLEVGRSTQPIDREACKESVKWCYEFAGHKVTPYMWFCDSPIKNYGVENMLAELDGKVEDSFRERGIDPSTGHREDCKFKKGLK